MSGQADASYEHLRETLARQRGASWSACASGSSRALPRWPSARERNRSRKQYQGSPCGGRADTYLKGAYADFLLDEERYAEVAALLKNELRADALLLRLTLAEQKFVDRERAGTSRRSRRVFSASCMRGDSLHRREEARFSLHVLSEPQGEALRLAQRTGRRTASAGRPYLPRSRAAAGTPGEARPVLDWLRDNRVEDFRLAALAQQAAR